MRSTARFVALGAALTLTFGLACAQTGTLPQRIKGTVASFDGKMLVVATSDGQTTPVKLPGDVRIVAFANRKLTDIQAGEFVGSAAIEGTDHKLHAQEVHIFPESMRGTGEGHRPMSMPQQTMTNATVAEVASAPSGSVLELKYAGGQQQIEVGPEARIVMIVPGGQELLKPGAEVRVYANKGPDGTLIARFVQAEKDGVKPLD